MYNRTFWLDHVEENGTVIQQGTNMSQDNFNNEELGIFESWVAGLLLAQKDRLQQDENAEAKIVAVSLENVTSATLTNVVLAAGDVRHKVDYNVIPVVASITGSGANIASVVVSQKQANGFKLTATGTWDRLNLVLYVQGGML